MPYSARLEKVLGEPDGILAGVSGGKAALRIARTGGELSNATILRIKAGMYGEPQSLRQLGAAYAEELLERHGDEIRQVMGEATEDAAAEWLVYVADPELSRVRTIGGDERPDGISLQAIQEAAAQAAQQAVASVSGSLHFWHLISQMQKEWGRPIPVWLNGGGEGLTVEEAERQAAVIRELMLEEFGPPSVSQDSEEDKAPPQKRTPAREEVG